MKHFDLSAIMRRAWRIFRKYAITFAEALHRAWQVAKSEPINAARVDAARVAAGITEAVNTWAGWRDLGFEVEHGSKAVFQTILLHPSKGDTATYTASFFTASQVVTLGTQAA